MSEITVYEKPTCTTCKNVHQALVDSGVDFNAVNYYVESVSEEKLTELVGKMNIKASELFRKKETLYKELELDTKEVSDEEAIKLMCEHPDLLQRPIVEKGDKAILARPAERLQEIL